MSEPKLLGNGKLTLSARLSMVYGATAVTILAVLGAFFAPKAWDMLVEIHGNVQMLKTATAIGVERDSVLKERVDKLEGRVVFLEQKRATP